MGRGGEFVFGDGGAFGQADAEGEVLVLDAFGHTWPLKEWHGEDIGVRGGFEVPEERTESVVPAYAKGVVPAAE